MHVQLSLALLTASQAFLAGALPKPPSQSEDLGGACPAFYPQVPLNELTSSVAVASAVSIDPAYSKVSIVIASAVSALSASAPAAFSSVQSLQNTPATPNSAQSTITNDVETSTTTLRLTRSDDPADAGSTSASAVTNQSRSGSEVPIHALSVNSTTLVTFADASLQLQTVTVTGLNSSQTPTITSGVTQNAPDTSGSIITSLETGGNPPVQPFPTNISTVASATLQPLNSTAPYPNITISSALGTVIQTVTLPLTTFETIVVTSTVATVPIETVVTVTQATLLNNTITTQGSTIVTALNSTTVLTTTATALAETTLAASTTIVNTVATTVTTNGAVTTIPTGVASCAPGLSCYGQDIFLPIDVGQPPAVLPQQGGHPVPRLGINDNGAIEKRGTDDNGPIETNKFYANFFLGSQGSPCFSTPYSLTWSKGSGNAQSWGMSVAHIDDDQKVFGPDNTQIPGSPDQYFINPLGIQSVILSAVELGSNTVLTSDSLQQFSGNFHLSPTTGETNSITFPIVEGMAFVTALYTNLQPAIQSSVFFRSVTFVDSPKAGIFKYQLILEDGNTWLLYATPSNGLDPNFQLVSSTLLQGLPSWSGSIQVAKNPANSPQTIYDDACGAYPTTGQLTGYAVASAAEYSIAWTKGGLYAANTTLLMFALPHHVQSFGNVTETAIQSTLQLASLTQGMTTAVSADNWVLVEDELPVSMGFAPWRPGNTGLTSLSTTALALIQNVSAMEASQNMSAQTDLNSMYYSGKALSKFAQLVYTMHELTGQQALANAALVELKASYQVFLNNTQVFPLLYDTDWKGVVSSASYITGNSGDDFGNSYYNDHHFHYGYFLHAAAIIGYLDPYWASENKDYVNALARDVSNPSSLDQYFPVFRSFDWYAGHSWAKGLFESGDGKDEESSSEDTMFAYGLKMWGKTIGDASMEARGNLMLAVLARSLQSYFLLESDNINQPAQFIDNKVTGILFQNKIDHTTYFGTDFSYIEGIHMIPIMPFSTLTRTQQFVTEEWNAYFADNATEPASSAVQGGWRGILYANLAIINPEAAWNFFSQPDFDFTFIDGGATLTWYLTMAAMFGGAS